jgi:hypothetical protein
MENLFVPHEIAKQLKKAGFNEPCIAEYVNGFLTNHMQFTVEDEDRNSDWSTYTNSSTNWTQTKDRTVCSAPTYEQVINWLDSNNVVIEIQIDRTAEPKYCFEVFKYEHFGNWKKHEPSEWFLYRNRTEATNVAINEALKLI